VVPVLMKLRFSIEFTAPKKVASKSLQKEKICLHHGFSLLSECLTLGAALLA
jgi:hypothetical protein